MKAPPFAKADRDLLRSDLSPAAKIVAIVIVDEMRRKGRVAIGNRRLAGETGLSRSGVARAVQEIADSGVLVVDRRGRGQRLRFRLPAQSVAGVVAPAETVSVPPAGQVEKLQVSHGRDRVSHGRVTSDPRAGHVQTQTVKPDVGEHPPASSSRKRTKTKTPKTGSDHHAVIDHFASGWSERHAGAKYVFAAGRDGKAVQAVLDAAGGDLHVAKLIVDSYLDDAETYIADREHPLSLIQTRLSKYSAQAARATTTTVNTVDDHPLIRDAITQFGADAIESHRPKLDAIVAHVESGGLVERRVRSAMKSAKDVAAFVAMHKSEEVVAHAG